jgi:cysteinyl-tRNA synthetase
MKKLLVALLLLLFASCQKDENLKNINFRQEMRNFVIKISEYAKNKNPNFQIIPQNGQALVTSTGDESGTPEIPYLSAINGTGREDLFYGYDQDDKATPADDTKYMLSLCQVCKKNNIVVLTTDYCYSHDKIDDSYKKNASYGFISFAAPDRSLCVIPDYPPEAYNANNQNITSLNLAKNFLYLINPENFSSKDKFINAISQTNYDVIIMDLFFNDKNTEFTASEIARLKTKHNGGKRLVICYMSIGEAENYRYYWHNDWKVGNPVWIEKENPHWKGNFKVRYWDKNWQKIIYGNKNAYLDKIINAGFDGVYLDIIDAYEYFENITKKG